MTAYQTLDQLPSDVAELVLKVQAVKAKVAEPQMPSGYHAHMPSDEPEVLGLKDEDEPLANIVGIGVFLIYRDEFDKQQYERRVTIQFAYRRHETGNIRFRAFCHETKTVHSFRVKDVVKIVDPVNGMEITDQDEFLRHFALVKSEEAMTQAKTTYDAIKKYSAGLNVLKFLSFCDGHYHNREEEVMIHYFMHCCFMDDVDEALFLNHIRRLYPDRLTFYRSVEALAKDKGHFGKILDYGQQLIEADGLVTQEEASYILELREEKDDAAISDWVELELKSMIGVGPIKIRS